jgi:hypothetical protein
MLQTMPADERHRYHESWFIRRQNLSPQVREAVFFDEQIRRPDAVGELVSGTGGGGSDIGLDRAGGSEAAAVETFTASFRKLSFGHNCIASVTWPTEDDKREDKKRVGLLFDSALTAYLMMGHQGLKPHAVRALVVTAFFLTVFCR